MAESVRELIGTRPLLWDGATGTQYQNAGLDDDAFVLRGGTDSVAAAAERLAGKPLDGCNDILCLTRPELVAQVHRDYFLAGADIVESNSFGATSIVLADYDVPELVYDVCAAAARIARSVADEFTDKPRFVAGALGPGTKLLTLGQTTWQEVESTYSEGFRALLEHGADLLLVETQQDLLLMKAAMIGAVQAMNDSGRQVPLVVQITIEQTGTMLMGSETAAALNLMEAFPAVCAVGLNCATGPVEMAPHVRFLSENSTRPISVQPNAGLPVMEQGRAVYKLGPEELAEHHVRFVEEYGVAMVGGCCGTTPAHIEAVAAALEAVRVSDSAHWRQVSRLFPGFDFRLSRPEQSDAFKLRGTSSLYMFQPHKQDSSFLIVGERTNANGSKAFREMLGHENWDGLTEIAREIEAEGCHLIDVCAAYVGRDEEADMRRLLTRYNKSVTVPVMIDSTETHVIEASLQCLAGKPIVNSINFEDGEARTEAVLGLCSRYGAAVVGLTIDESGMAKSAQKKFEIASRIVEKARAAGLQDHDVFIDCLTFTLGSGDEEFRASARETLDAIRLVREEFPHVNTILGVSNVSFGLKAAARTVLNSVFLEEAVEAGLTAAIVHYSKLVPFGKPDEESWKIAEDLVYDRREFALT